MVWTYGNELTIHIIFSSERFYIKKSIKFWKMHSAACFLGIVNENVLIINFKPRSTLMSLRQQQTWVYMGVPFPR